jgi:DNA-binding winged helix-turn-helix (wHTH) protein/Tol biopolymer transport system component
MPPPGYSFGPYCFDQATGLLTRDGEPVPITFKAASLLRLLLDRQGAVVTKDEILKEVWPGTHVTDSNIAFHIRLIRRALEDDGEGQRYIETLPKRGYRFAAPLTLITPDEANIADRAEPVEPRELPASPTAPIPAPEPLLAPPQAGSATRWIAFGLLVVVSGLVALASGADVPLPRVVAERRLTNDGEAKSDLMPFDSTRLVVTMGNVQQRLARIADGGYEDLPLLKEFRLLDVSRDRRQALAIRPADRGAEDGLWIVSLENEDKRRLGMIRVDGHAAWSPTGRQVAYAYQGRMFVADTQSAEVDPLPVMSGYAVGPRWSADGRFIRVLFEALNDRTVTTTYWDIDVASKELRRPIERQDIVNPWRGRWIPESNEFVFLAGEMLAHLWVITERRTLFGGARELGRLDDAPGRFYEMVPSEDGRRLFVVKSPPPQLLRYDRGRDEFVPFLGGTSVFQVASSPDGRWMTYIQHPTGVLWRARADGTEPSRLTSPGFKVSGAAWSPDGQTLAIRAEEPGRQAKVYLLPSGGGTPQPIDPRNVNQGIPSWRPDGRCLTFGDVPEQFGKPTGSERVVVFDLATRSTAVVPGSAGLWSSRWSPDGRFLAALEIETGELHVYDFARKHWRSLHVQHANEPTWSRDSQYVYLDPEGPERSLRRVRVSDGSVEQVVDLSRFVVPWAGVLPDGTPLVLRRMSDLYALDLQRR